MAKSEHSAGWAAAPKRGGNAGHARLDSESAAKTVAAQVRSRPTAQWVARRTADSHSPHSHRVPRALCGRLTNALHYACARLAYGIGRCPFPYAIAQPYNEISGSPRFLGRTETVDTPTRAIRGCELAGRAVLNGAPPSMYAATSGRRVADETRDPSDAQAPSVSVWEPAPPGKTSPAADQESRSAGRAPHERNSPRYSSGASRAAPKAPMI